MTLTATTAATGSTGCHTQKAPHIVPAGPPLRDRLRQDMPARRYTRDAVADPNPVRQPGVRPDQPAPRGADRPPAGLLRLAG